MRDFNSFVALLRRKRVRPAFVTFEPVAGLQSYTPRPQGPDVPTSLHKQVCYGRLLNNLRRIIRIMRPGGYVFLGKPFALDDLTLGDQLASKPLKEYEAFKILKAFCDKERCTLHVESLLGIRFLIRKRLDADTSKKK
jgi:hypothetical protein